MLVRLGLWLPVKLATLMTIQLKNARFRSVSFVHSKELTNHNTKRYSVSYLFRCHPEVFNIIPPYRVVESSNIHQTSHVEVDWRKTIKSEIKLYLTVVGPTFQTRSWHPHGQGH